MNRIAFVIPWYGDTIRGGAESECNKLAHCLQEAGIQVEVLSTCVKEAVNDRGINNMPAGVTVESGITVRRFKVKPQNKERYGPSLQKIYRGDVFSAEDEKAYLEEDINSPDMYDFIEKHNKDYDWFIFIPYLYPPSYFGRMRCLDNAVSIPCLHDEGFARMTAMKECMSSFRKMIFLSKPESDLANSLYDLSTVDTAGLGAYVDSGWEDTADPEAFRRKYDIKNDFILCAGRKDPGKKTDMLQDYFCRYIEEHPEYDIKLVFIGGGEWVIPDEYQDRIIDLGFVSAEDKYNAYAAALALCNPSFMESFSIVIMESWLAKRPVFVSEQCKVTANFCVESNGGLYFDDFNVFCGCMDFMMENREIIDQMGINGYEYVQSHFTKKAIQHKYIEFLQK